MHFLVRSIVGRVKDIFKTPDGRQISPFQVEDVLLSEPQGLIADAVVAGVVTIPTLKSNDELKGEVARCWIVLSDEGKNLGADAVIKELEIWYQPRLGNHKWLHGGIEIVDKVYIHGTGFFLKFQTTTHFTIQDPQVDIGQAVESKIEEKV